MPLLIALLFLIGLLLLQAARRRQVEAGLPPGRVVYLDTEDLRRPERPLYDPENDLTGRPDYLVETEGDLVPVEVKSGRAPSRPYPSHVFQLAAYCLLVHAHYGRRPPYGILHYADRAYAVDYSRALESETRRLIAEMHGSGGRSLDRSHESSARCRGCGFHEVCDQRLT